MMTLPQHAYAEVVRIAYELETELLYYIKIVFTWLLNNIVRKRVVLYVFKTFFFFLGFILFASLLKDCTLLFV